MESTEEIVIPEVMPLDAEDTPGLLIVPNAQSLATLDDAVVQIDKLAKAYTCTTDEDYLRGDAEIARIRKITSLFEGIFTPVKKFWQAKHKEAVADEQNRVTRLGTAKGTIWQTMEAYREKKEKERKEEEERQLALERQRAEEELLARAEGLPDEEAALAMLDQEPEVAPVILAPAVPKLQYSKLVTRGKTGVTDLRSFLICVGATLLSKDERCSKALAKHLAPFTSPLVESMLVNPEHVEKMCAGFKSWADAEQRAKGSAFTVPGVAHVKQKGLG